MILPDEGYGYYWFRHESDGSTFIACKDLEDGQWYMPGLGHPINEKLLAEKATMLGPVPRVVVGGASIDN